MKRRGVLVVLSGFSGSGKGTIIRELVGRYDNYALSVSATTRKPRQGETDGREYFFRTKEEFEQMIADGRLLEYAQYVNNYYGTPRDYVEQKLDEGFDVILEIEIQGAFKIKEKFPDAVLMFMMPPTAMELKRRLEGRGTEDADAVRARLMRAVEESCGVEDYDYIVINDTIDTCTERVHNIIESEHSRARNNIDIIEGFKSELKDMWKGVTQ